MSDQYLQSLIQVLEKAADPTNATQMKRYMKDRYEFFGIKAPECKELVAPFFVKDGLPSKDEYEDIVRNAWNEPQRELQYFAMELTFKVRKYWEESTLELLEFMILNKSWWDSVDYIAATLAGFYFQKYPGKIKPVTGRWIESDNMWLNRTAILFQLKYKVNTDQELLFNYIERCSHSDEFFIRKAIGWALRELSKRYPDSVTKFVATHSLKTLSEREAMRLIKKDTVK